jgi:Kelch motif
MPSVRTDVAVAEVGGKIYVVGGFRGERELEIYDPAADRGASIPRALHHAAALTEESMIASCSLKDCAASRQLSGMSRVFLQTGHSPQRPDCLAGAAGFEPLHLLRIRAGGFEPLLFRIGIRQVAGFEPLHLGIRSAALAVAQSAHLTSFVGHPRLLPTRCAPDHFRMEMQMFESSRPSQPVGVSATKCQRGLKTVRHRGVSQVGALNHGI